jgi:hypothetical protein
MLNLRKITIDYFVQELQAAYRRTYSDMETDIANVIAWSGRLALENIANTTALYHNMEHTIMVTLVGQSILEGKHLCEGGVTPSDWMHVTIALLCHDIGYVRGVCRNDHGLTIATGIELQTVQLEPGGSDASLTAYHVDRGKLFVRERFNDTLTSSFVDPERIAGYIEMTRFPVPMLDSHRETRDFAGLVRAADYIGQLGDPDYLRKGPALFYEFEETGVNANYGYTCPGDLRSTFVNFYWKEISPYIQPALHYLRQTQEGQEWIARLYALIFETGNRNS